MKRIISVITAIALILAAALACAESYSIGIGQFAQHGSLDNCYQGFLAGLAEAGIVEGENLTVSYTADETGYAPLEEKIAAFKEQLYTDEVKPGSIVYDFEQKNEAFQTSGQVQYVALCGNFEREGYDYTGALRILRVMLSYDYLWINIRVKGGAYGCGGAFGRGGNACISS